MFVARRVLKIKASPRVVAQDVYCVLCTICRRTRAQVRSSGMYKYLDGQHLYALVSWKLLPVSRRRRSLSSRLVGAVPTYNGAGQEER